MYLITVVAPLINFVGVLLVGRFVGRHGVSIFTVFGLLIAVVCACIALYDVSFCKEICEIKLLN
jgi:NADH:ubiquinone oxidoreductase subunit 5 (subunit L)/multisubunit Na+/H+ antiporter MnhA subunit